MQSLEKLEQQRECKLHVQAHATVLVPPQGVGLRPSQFITWLLGA